MSRANSLLPEYSMYNTCMIALLPRGENYTSNRFYFYVGKWARNHQPDTNGGDGKYNTTSRDLPACDYIARPTALLTL